MDRWAETVDDSLRPSRYRLDGAWVPLEIRTEIYLGPTGDTIAVDTLRFTHRGPMRRVGRRWLSLRWTALESGERDGGVPSGARRARTAREWLDAMASYRSPPQNMLVADRAGTIAIRSHRTVSDAPGRRPRRSHPRRLDPRERIGPATGPWPTIHRPLRPRRASSPPPIRSRRTRATSTATWAATGRCRGARSGSTSCSAADHAVTPDAMRQMADGSREPAGRHYRPLPPPAPPPPGRRTALAQRAAQLLAGWDRRYTIDNEGAVLFEAVAALGDGHAVGRAPVRAIRPGRRRVLRPARRPDESMVGRAEHARAGRAARRRARRRRSRRAIRPRCGSYGPPEFGGWRWSRVHRIDIWHLLHLPALVAAGHCGARRTVHDQPVERHRAAARDPAGAWWSSSAGRFVAGAPIPGGRAATRSARATRIDSENGPVAISPRFAFLAMRPRLPVTSELVLRRAR